MLPCSMKTERKSIDFPAPNNLAKAPRNILKFLIYNLLFRQHGFDPLWRLWTVEVNARFLNAMHPRRGTDEVYRLALIYLPLGGVHYKAPWLINAVDDWGLQGAIKASHIDLRLVVFCAEPV